MEYYAAERKKELLPFARVWMELESIMLTEVSQEVKDRCRMILPISLWKLIHKKNKQAKYNQRH